MEKTIRETGTTWYVNRHRERVTITDEVLENLDDVYLVHVISSDSKPNPDDFIQYSRIYCCKKYSCIDHVVTNLLLDDEPTIFDEFDDLFNEIYDILIKQKGLLGYLKNSLRFLGENDDFEASTKLGYEQYRDEMKKMHDLGKRYRFLERHYYGAYACETEEDDTNEEDEDDTEKEDTNEADTEID